MSKYLETVVQASGGFAAPAENLKEKDIRESLKAAGVLVPEEQDLADALLEVVEKHGKFNEDNTGVWAGYTSAKRMQKTPRLALSAVTVSSGNHLTAARLLLRKLKKGASVVLLFFRMAL